MSASTPSWRYASRSPRFEPSARYAPGSWSPLSARCARRRSRSDRRSAAPTCAPPRRRPSTRASTPAHVGDARGQAVRAAGGARRRRPDAPRRRARRSRRCRPDASLAPAGPRSTSSSRSTWNGWARSCSSASTPCTPISRSPAIRMRSSFIARRYRATLVSPSGPLPIAHEPDNRRREHESNGRGVHAANQDRGDDRAGNVGARRSSRRCSRQESTSCASTPRTARPTCTPNAPRSRAAAAASLDRVVGVLIDLPGPKLRTGPVANDEVELRIGHAVRAHREAIEGDEHRVSTTRARSSRSGFASATRCSSPTAPSCCASRRSTAKTSSAGSSAAGVLRSRKGMHVPRAEGHVEPFTDADAVALDMAVRIKADFVGLSFVRRPEDIEAVRARLPKRGRAVRTSSPRSRPRSRSTISRASSRPPTR